ncbi:MAG TPA: amidohydrolase family protein [Steroidobacteraceae bacterium]
MKIGRVIALTVLFAISAPLAAQVPTAELMKPPANARHFIIESTGGKHGDSYMWVSTDGVRMGRESMNLRGQVWEIDYSGKSGPDGMPANLAVRGINPQGDVAETFDISGGTARWKSPIDSGTKAYTTPGFYASLNSPMDATAWFLERLLAMPERALPLLPGGAASAVKLTSLEVSGKAPADKIKVDLWAISGINNSPIPIWADQNGRFFALTSGIGWLPESYAGEQAKLEKAQTAAMAAHSARLAKELVKTPAAPVVFAHVRLFDADGGRFLADQSVVVDKGEIVAVGPASSINTPANAQIIDGHGKTLVPGLWDCHMHVGDDYTGVQELSLGVTSVRDPGNDDLLTMDRRKRVGAGQLLFPHVYPSSLIDGKGPYTAQVANVATSQAEAIALVDRAKANGFTGVKFYGTFNPAWLPASINEAHKLGLHVHGHIPAGIRPMDAINDGYDEVTHINWIIMQAMPDSVIAVSNGIMRFEGPGRFAKDVDLDGPAMTQIVRTMATKHIYSDPTMVAFESLYVPDNGDLSPSYAPFIGTLPPTLERGFRTGGFAVPKDLTRADYRASWAKMIALLKKMHEAGVPIVAGTDGSGIEIVRELEVYQQAGFTAAQALAAATIVPARLVGQDQHTGSIKVGKTADLSLVEGDPSVRIGALRQTRVVMLDGKMLDADALRKAAGYSGRPQ